jgi:hypothetical protein
MAFTPAAAAEADQVSTTVAAGSGLAFTPAAVAGAILASLQLLLDPAWPSLQLLLLEPAWPHYSCC